MHNQATPPSYDSQASSYNRRAGIPHQACEAVANRILRVASRQHADLILEVAAGTGLIGCYLARSGMGYLGLDRSLPMLEVFRKRLERPGRWLLLQADANDPWPLKAGRVQLIFCSRAIHLLSLEQVVKEALRLSAGDGVLLLIGRVRRGRRTSRSGLRRQMLSLLRAEGWSPRDSDNIMKSLRQLGCQVAEDVIGSCVVSHWHRQRTLQEAFDDWAKKDGLAGVSLPESVKGRVLAQLERWAVTQFGQLNKPEILQESYELEGFLIKER